MQHRLFLLILVIGVLSQSVSAETPAAELFTGYSFASLDSEVENEATSGLGVDLNIALNDWAGIAVDASFQWGNVGTAGLDIDFDAQIYLFGPRFTKRGDKGSAFFHVLAGVARLGALGTSESEFAMGIGGGGDVRLNDWISYRVAQVDYIPVFADGETLNNFRVMTGILFDLGSK